MSRCLRCGRFCSSVGLGCAGRLARARAVAATSDGFRSTISGARPDRLHHLCVIFITLVLQGPTLAPFARRLGTPADEEEGVEEVHARLAVAEAGLRTHDDPVVATSPHPEVVRYLRQRHRQRARRWAAREAGPHHIEPEGAAHDHFVPAPSHKAAAIDERRAEEYRRVRSAMLNAEQAAVLDLRDRGIIDDDVMRHIQRDLDLETLLLETSEPVTETPSEVASAIETSG